MSLEYLVITKQENAAKDYWGNVKRTRVKSVLSGSSSSRMWKSLTIKRNHSKVTIFTFPCCNTVYDQQFISIICC